MRLVDVLLSSQFVKDLEDMKGEEKGEVSDVSEDPVALGKDVLSMLGELVYCKKVRSLAAIALM